MSGSEANGGLKQQSKSSLRKVDSRASLGVKEDLRNTSQPQLKANNKNGKVDNRTHTLFPPGIPMASQHKMKFVYDWDKTQGRERHVRDPVKKPVAVPRDDMYLGAIKPDTADIAWQHLDSDKTRPSLEDYNDAPEPEKRHRKPQHSVMDTQTDEGVLSPTESLPIIQTPKSKPKPVKRETTPPPPSDPMVNSSSSSMMQESNKGSKEECSNDLKQGTNNCYQDWNDACPIEFLYPLEPRCCASEMPCVYDGLFCTKIWKTPPCRVKKTLVQLPSWRVCWGCGQVYQDEIRPIQCPEKPHTCNFICTQSQDPGWASDSAGTFMQENDTSSCNSNSAIAIRLDPVAIAEACMRPDDFNIPCDALFDDPVPAKSSRRRRSKQPFRREDKQ